MSEQKQKQPEPYKPPPDTSLAASIERHENRYRNAACDRSKRDGPRIPCGDCECGLCDTLRIIEAAMKWDNLRLLTRVCVVDDSGRQFDEIYGSVEVKVQDHFQTIKLFCSEQSSDPDGGSVFNQV